MSTRAFCTFRLDGRRLGIDVHQVLEVLRAQEVTPVPHCGAAVAGLVNLRGQVACALDLRLGLGLPPRAPDAPPVSVVVRVHGRPVTLLVDEIGDVIEVEGARLEPVPGALRSLDRSLFEGVCQQPDDLLLVLDIAATVAAILRPRVRAA